MKLIELRDPHCKPMYLAFWLDLHDGRKQPIFTQALREARKCHESKVAGEVDAIKAVRPNADLHAVEAQ